MSEYQYYEFQAVDRALTEEDRRRMRAVSTRAAITSRSFVNSYEWGDFKGDAFGWMQRWFDGFLYLANWGTHELMLRLPLQMLDAETGARFCPGEVASASADGEHVVLSYRSEDESGEWEDDGTGLLSAILPVRTEIAAGDHRALYLGWLLWAQDASFEHDGAEREPAVPPGLRTLSAAQQAFAGFLRIDEDLVRVAAAASADAPPAPEGVAVEAWLATLPETERMSLLVRVMRGEEGAVRADLVRRHAGTLGREAPAGAAPRRTVKELLDAAEAMRDERRRVDEERKARKKARLEAALAANHERCLDILAATEEDAWRRVDALIATKQPKRYDEAVALVRDLRELAAREGRLAQAEARIDDLREWNAKKPSLLERLNKAVSASSRPSSLTMRLP
ncbi:MAG: hypothetical protein JWM27_1893 [Gemmatimonadetes bacterium]|nr:hypothetical protein [Gemmatimonadota bacterium]